MLLAGRNILVSSLKPRVDRSKQTDARCEFPQWRRRVHKVKVYKLESVGLRESLAMEGMICFNQP